MNDFLIYAACLQDAGFSELSISLTTRQADKMRMMVVSLRSGCYPQSCRIQHPPRVFELDGTDRVLQQLKDDLLYNNEDITAKKIQEMVDENPLHADDLREWFEDLMRYPMPTKEEVDAEVNKGVASDDEASVQRTLSYVKGLMRGMDSNREKVSRKGAA